MSSTTSDVFEWAEPSLNGRAGLTPDGRLIAQRGLFSGPDVICPVDLYAGVQSGDADRERDHLRVLARSVVSTDAYFGRFPASYWQRWTEAKDVTVQMVATGSGQISLWASDANGDTRVVASERVKDAQGTRVRFDTPLNGFLDGGYLWVDFATADAPLEIRDLYWSVAAPDQLRPTSIVICTFNRADDCLKTMRAIAGDQHAMQIVETVYVVDQGTDTVSSRPSFSEVSASLGGRLKYIRQPNLGGAGGFSRGMYEVVEVDKAEHANILLMDDDVLCEPEIIIRLAAFANRTVEPTIVGGQMLRLFKPTWLFAGAEYVDFPNLLGGQVVTGALDDVDLLDEAVDEDDIPTGKPNRGDRRVDADYNAWWSCLIPSELISELGYPLPLFFQWDDIEFGYRARAHGYATVTLPGAGVWHADFDRKDLDKWNEYFAVRNSLVVSALHTETDPSRTARALGARILRSLVAMQYGFTATLIKAVEDFLDGPKLFADGGVAAATEIRKLRASYPDTMIHPPTAVPGYRSGELPMVPAAPEPSMDRLVLIKRLLMLAAGKPTYELGTVPHADSKWWHVSLFDTVIVSDASQEGVRIRRRDRRLMMSLARQAVRTLRRLIAETPRLREEYRAAVPKVTSKENWRSLYRIE